MNGLLKILAEFFIIFIVVFIIYKLLYKRKKDFSKLNNRDEIKSFVLKYDLDIRKINYKKLLNVLALINSFIIAFATMIIYRIDNIIWSILVCFVVVMALMYALFSLAGRYFKEEESKYKEKKVEDSIKEVIKETKKKSTKRKRVNKNV